MWIHHNTLRQAERLNFRFPVCLSRLGAQLGSSVRFAVLVRGQEVGFQAEEVRGNSLDLYKAED